MLYATVTVPPCPFISCRIVRNKAASLQRMILLHHLIVHLFRFSCKSIVEPADILFNASLTEYRAACNKYIGAGCHYFTDILLAYTAIYLKPGCQLMSVQIFPNLPDPSISLRKEALSAKSGLYTHNQDHVRLGQIRINLF